LVADQPCRDESLQQKGKTQVELKCIEDGALLEKERVFIAKHRKERPDLYPGEFVSAWL
jgi:hypothetical protein